MQTIYLGPWQEFWYLGATKPSFKRYPLGKPTVSDGYGAQYKFGGLEVLWYEDKQCYSDGTWLEGLRRWTRGSIRGKSAKRTCKRVDDKYLAGSVHIFKNDSGVLLIPLSQDRWNKLMSLK